MKPEQVVGRPHPERARRKTAEDPNWLKNAIREQSPSEPADPPNLKRQTWQQSLQEGSVVEWVERFHTDRDKEEDDEPRRR